MIKQTHKQKEAVYELSHYAQNFSQGKQKVSAVGDWLEKETEN